MIGRIVKDIELTFTPNTGTAIAKFTIAVDRQKRKDHDKETDFVPITVFGKAAENVSTYLGKGSLIGISGRLQITNTKKDDGWKTYVSVIADETQFLDSKKGKPKEECEDMTQMPDDSEVPF